MLWVTPQQPGPAGGGGSNHEFELLRALSPRHRIEVVSSFDGAELPGVDAELSTVAFPMHPAPTTRLQTTVALARSRGPLVGWPLRGRIEALRSAIRQRGPVDLTHVMMGEIAPVLDAVRGPSSLLLFDSYVRHAEALLAIEDVPRRKLRWHIERRTARSFERRWYRKPTALACVSTEDARSLESLLHRPVEVIPNPLAENFFAAPTVTRSSNLVLFVGSMGYPPNGDAIRWFMADVWPEVLAQRPDAEFLAVGRGADAPDAVAALAALLGDRLALDVPDVRPYYWQAAVMVAPVRLGAGLRNKVIHAMACGSPVVATPIAAEGIGARHGEHLLLAEDADAFAGAVVDSLRDPVGAAARAERARALAAQFHVDVIADRMEQWWMRAVDAPSVAS